jgi:hypothetical protein
MRPVRLNDLHGWFREEAGADGIEPSHRRVILEVEAHLDAFVKWPEHPELLWQGCERRSKYHQYPTRLKELFRERGLRVDRRSNGPAVMAYLVAHGERPKRRGRNDCWTVHHIYDGKHPYDLGRTTLHAAKQPLHFTQSAGLVAIHPVAHALADEFAVFAWRLRAEAFCRFEYDPDGVFSRTQDSYGFGGPKERRKIWCSGD